MFSLKIVAVQAPAIDRLQVVKDFWEETGYCFSLSVLFAIRRLLQIEPKSLAEKIVGIQAEHGVRRDEAHFLTETYTKLFNVTESVETAVSIDAFVEKIRTGDCILLLSSQEGVEKPFHHTLGLQWKEAKFSVLDTGQVAGHILEMTPSQLRTYLSGYRVSGADFVRVVRYSQSA